MLLSNEGSLGAGVRGALSWMSQLRVLTFESKVPFTHLVYLNNKVLYILWTFLTPWRNFIGLLVTHPEESTIHFREKAHQSYRTWHDHIWQENLLAVWELVALRVVLTQKERWSSSLWKWDTHTPLLPLSLQKTHPEARIWGKGKYKGFTLYKDGGLGKGDAKPKDTMLRANKGDSLRTGRGLSSVWNTLSLSGILSMLNSRTSVSAGGSLVHVSV